MKASIYNGYVVKDDKTIVYNTRYNNAIAVKNTDVDKIKNELLSNDNTELSELGFIVGNDENEISEAKCNYNIMKYTGSDELNIMIIMTYKCNCNCTYCFENITGTSCIENEKIDSVIDYLIRVYRKNNSKIMKINFFGGEPMLRKKDMIYISDRLKTEKISFIVNVITNGTLLNYETVEELVAADIRTFQITLDGPKAIHDIRRPMKNGESAWGKICDALAILATYDTNVTIRINIDSGNVEYLEEIIDAIPEDIKKKNSTTIYIAPVVGCKIENMKKTLVDRTNNIKTAWEMIKEKNLPISISPPTYAPCPYSSLDSAFYIDLCGNVYTCGGFVGEVDKIERNMDDKTDRFWGRVESQPKEKCFGCQFFYVCMGGCVYETEKFGGHCQYTYLKEIYDEYYGNYAE